ncbi:MAG TPA: type II secretion system protein GspC [Pseudobdellovibrionaceae bacterium]|nr:type II secretion system protein GspC [Pseudobdellovibrionaceae bacterium]
MKKFPIQAIYPFVVVTLLSYMLVDLVLLKTRSAFIPNSPPPASGSAEQFNSSTPPRSSYQAVTSRNIFASNGIIPDPLVEEGGAKKKKDNEPIPTTLPFSLIGTLVHSNPLKSIANIEKRGSNKSQSYTVNRDVEDLAKVVRIERYKVIIRNLATGNLEFLEMKQDSKVNFGAQAVALPPSGPVSEDIKQVGDNQFQIKRSDLDKHLKDLSSVLMQARAVPVRNPNTGEIECYRMMEIAPNSIISQLRLQKGDCIKSVNGNRIDSPTKAMELFQALKGSSTINLTVDRNGSNVTSKYSISN